MKTVKLFRHVTYKVTSYEYLDLEVPDALLEDKKSVLEYADIYQWTGKITDSTYLSKKIDRVHFIGFDTENKYKGSE